MALKITKTDPNAYYADQTLKKLDARIKTLNKTLGVGNRSSQRIMYMLEQMNFQYAGINTTKGILEDAIRRDANGNIIGLSRSRNVITNMANHAEFRKAAGKALEYAEFTGDARKRYLEYYKEWKGSVPKGKLNQTIAIQQVANKLDELDDHLRAILDYVYKLKDRDDILEEWHDAVNHYDANGKLINGGFMTNVNGMVERINVLLDCLDKRGYDTIAALSVHGQKAVL